MMRSLRDNSFLYDPRRVVWASLALSFLFHVIIFLVFQKMFPSPWTTWEYRTYRVNMFRPPVENSDQEEIPEPGTTHLKREQPSPGGEAATISLETKDKRYISYTRMIKERILHTWEYPMAARKKRMEGRLTLIFTIEKSGRLTRVEIEKSSGHDLLDREATRAISTSDPFPPFPDQITFKRLHIKAAFDYQLTKKK